MSSTLMSRASRAPVAVSDPPTPTRGVRGAVLAAHWPLTITLIGFPLWWVLGLRTIMPMLMAVVMADQLLRRRRISVPPGFMLWALFLAWVGLGVFVLWSDAPGAVSGGGPSRLLVFGYRLAWYLTCTTVLVWVANLREDQLSSRWLHQLLGFMFVVTTFGGLLGVLAPTFEFRSLVELLLPGGIRSNSLVQSIAHPAVADIQNVLGRPEARPKAPFPYANSWGSNLALDLPFFLVAWIRDGRRWQRLAAPVVLAVAAVPIVYSLNRGLWICLVMGVVGALVLQLRTRRTGTSLVALLAVGALVAIFFVSPLGTIFQERLAHQHSNDRRSLLLSQTVASTVEGSPVVGFGSTRDVEGSFASIAGASTPDCKACGVPPLGTQGHIWLVIFSQGLLGVAMFVAFFAAALSRCWRCRTTNETLCTFVLAFLALQLFIYDTLGMPLFTVMIAIGLVWREQSQGRPGVLALHDARRLARRLRAAAPFLALTTVVGAALGAVATTVERPVYSTKVAIQLEPVPSYVDTTIYDGPGPVDQPADATIDTEAAMLLSRASLGGALGTTSSAALDRLRKRVSVTAVPNTPVLLVTVRAGTAERSGQQARDLAASFLRQRGRLLVDRRDQTLTNLRNRMHRVARVTDASTFSRRATGLPATTSVQLATVLSRVTTTPVDPGQVVNTSSPTRQAGTVEIPVTSGAALGLALGALVLAGRRGSAPWRPGRRSGRR